MRVRTTALVCTAVLAAATACADTGPAATAAGPPPLRPPARPGRSATRPPSPSACSPPDSR
ncbi:hypothetical protein ACFQ1I_42965 [Kitasatospora arboriphila]